jgi:BsaWI restriction endonuclease type 2
LEVLSLATDRIYDNEAQSLRSASGKQFEKNVAETITNLLSKEGIYARNIRDLRKAIKREPGLSEVLEYAHLMIPSPCTQRYELILPDTDIIAYYLEKDRHDNTLKRFHLATISCKVSFHSRHTESAFWSYAFRGHGKRFVLEIIRKFQSDHRL